MIPGWDNPATREKIEAVWKAAGLTPTEDQIAIFQAFWDDDLQDISAFKKDPYLEAMLLAIDPDWEDARPNTEFLNN